MSEESKKRFKRVYIEIIDYCNLDCRFCLPLTRPKGKMTEEQFCHLLDEIKPYTDYVYLHVKGEPLLHDELSRFLDLAYDKKIHVNMTTNGVLLNNQTTMLLSKPAIRQINISLHALGEMVKSKQIDYLKHLVLFLQAVKEQGEKLVSLRFWLGNNPLKESVIQVLNEAFSIHITDDTTVLFDRVFLSYDEEFIWPEASTIKSPYQNCLGLKDHFGILVDGSVVPCCLDGNGKVVLGNLFQQPLSQMMESENWTQVSKSFINRKNLPELCEFCQYKNRFAR